MGAQNPKYSHWKELTKRHRIYGSKIRKDIPIIKVTTFCFNLYNWQISQCMRMRSIPSIAMFDENIST